MNKLLYKFENMLMNYNLQKKLMKIINYYWKLIELRNEVLMNHILKIN